MLSLSKDYRTSPSSSPNVGENKVTQKLQQSTRNDRRAPRVLGKVLAPQVQATSYQASLDAGQKAQAKGLSDAYARNVRSD